MANQIINQVNNQLILPSLELRQFKNDQQRFAFWRTSTPIQKLEIHGLNKLQILATEKGFTDIYDLDRESLLYLLAPLVNENDYPIGKPKVIQDPDKEYPCKIIPNKMCHHTICSKLDNKLDIVNG